MLKNAVGKKVCNSPISFAIVVQGERGGQACLALAEPPPTIAMHFSNALQSYEKFLKPPNILPIISTDFQKNIHFSLN